MVLVVVTFSRQNLDLSITFMFTVCVLCMANIEQSYIEVYFVPLSYFFGFIFLNSMSFPQILAVGAEPLLTRFNMNGDIVSQIQCAPTSAFSVSLHPSGVSSVFTDLFVVSLV